MSATAAKRRSRTLPGLPGLTAWRRSFSPNTRMPRPHSVAYPPWGLLRSLPRRGLGCPMRGSVKRPGVGLKGNGVANEAPALAKADRARGTRLHYFPPGTYRIRSSLTLSKPVIMGGWRGCLLCMGWFGAADGVLFGRVARSPRGWPLDIKRHRMVALSP